MSGNVSQNGLTTIQARAALLVAEDAISDEQIGVQCGVTERTIERWKKQDAFVAAVNGHKTRWREEIEQQGIANRQNRVDALNERWRKMQTVIEERAADESWGAFDTFTDDDGTTHRAIAPGWTTGLMVRTEKQIGAGEKAIRVVEFAVDTGLLRELRAHEEQAAKELGQWEDKQRIDGEMLVREYIGIPVDEV